jgi:hypothetical protein
LTIAITIPATTKTTIAPWIQSHDGDIQPHPSQIVRYQSGVLAR